VAAERNRGNDALLERQDKMTNLLFLPFPAEVGKRYGGSHVFTFTTKAGSHISQNLLVKECGF
jgi:hypothetical protein